MSENNEPVLGPPVDPPEDVWLNALSGALDDPRSAEDLADLLPGGTEPGDDVALDDLSWLDGADGDDAGDLVGDGGPADSDDHAEPDAHGFDGHLHDDAHDVHDGGTGSGSGLDHGHHG